MAPLAPGGQPWTHQSNFLLLALNGRAQLAIVPKSKKVVGLITSQGKCLSFGFSLQLGCLRETTDTEATDGCFSFTSMFLSLSCSFPSPLSENKYRKSFSSFFKFLLL